MSDEGTPPTSTQRLLDLYSSAAACRCDVSLYEHHEPEAPTVLALWASAVGRATERMEGEYPALDVATGPMSSIRVYLKVNEIRKAG